MSPMSENSLGTCHARPSKGQLSKLANQHSSQASKVCFSQQPGQDPSTFCLVYPGLSWSYSFISRTNGERGRGARKITKELMSSGRWGSPQLARPVAPKDTGNWSPASAAANHVSLHSSGPSGPRSSPLHESWMGDLSYPLH
jgi:hypothetical protein